MTRIHREFVQRVLALQNCIKKCLFRGIRRFDTIIRFHHVSGGNMRRALLLPILIVLIGIAGLSCERMNEEPTWEGLVALQDIPIEYGSLVSVTMTEQYPGWAQLWFQNDAGTINMVRIRWMTGQMLESTLTITRTQSASEGE